MGPPVLLQTFGAVPFSPLVLLPARPELPPDNVPLPEAVPPVTIPVVPPLAVELLRLPPVMLPAVLPLAGAPLVVPVIPVPPVAIPVPGTVSANVTFTKIVLLSVLPANRVAAVVEHSFTGMAGGGDGSVVKLLNA